MPLAFNSLSHGRIAFGFFNIDSDMLLLEHYFIFATDFCRYVSQIAESETGAAIETNWTLLSIDTPDHIGDLMGAIHGIRFVGFLGDIYKRYPFPENHSDFKQKPEGAQTQTIVRQIITPYAQSTRLKVCTNAVQSTITIGDFRFSSQVFNELLDYVWRGGYPQWRDNAPPAYVRAMRSAISASRQPLFHTEVTF